MKNFVILLLLSILLSCSSDDTSKRTVVYNKTTNTIHCTACAYTRKCSGDCDKMSMDEAIKKGGIVCKICKGTCGR